MQTPQAGAHLLGRSRERATLDGLIAAVRAGGSQALVVRGDPGVGKSALLEYVAERATGCRIVHAIGVESEMELAFAGLHQLSAPLLGRLERLPAPQRDALATAFGLQASEAPDRFLVSLAVLSLLGDAAEERPLVCLVDDAQWLDRATAQVLAFVARRVLAESIALVFASRQASDDGELSGLPQLAVEGLGYDDARALLKSVVPGPLDDRVGDRIIAETAGNPLALLELPRGRNPAELAGGFGLPRPGPLSARIEQSFARRVERMPEATQRLLLVAAAEPIGDPTLLYQAAAAMGVDVDEALTGAEELIRIDDRVRFRHPLVRSAVYGVASVAERRRVHAALADASSSAATASSGPAAAWARCQARRSPSSPTSMASASAACTRRRSATDATP